MKNGRENIKIIPTRSFSPDLLISMFTAGLPVLFGLRKHPSLFGRCVVLCLLQVLLLIWADPIEEIKTCIRAADQVSEEDPEGAQLLGVHLEGPFINPVYKGMQKEECCLLPDVTVMEDLYNTFKNKKLCRHMTIAPERPGAADVLDFCRKHQIQTAVGHSAATFEEIKKMRAYGLGGFTHTFSGMKGFHHRELGTAGAALYFDDMICEFAKQTGMTVSHEAFELAYRIKGSSRIVLTTDCCGLAQTQSCFDHYVRKIRFVKDGDQVCLEHYDGKKEWIDPRDYQAVKQVEMSYAREKLLTMKKDKSGALRYHVDDQLQSGSLYPCR